MGINGFSFFRRPGLWGMKNDRIEYNRQSVSVRPLRGLLLLSLISLFFFIDGLSFCHANVGKEWWQVVHEYFSSVPLSRHVVLQEDGAELSLIEMNPDRLGGASNATSQSSNDSDQTGQNIAAVQGAPESQDTQETLNQSPKKVVVLHPGYLETPATLIHMTEYFLKQDYHVFVVQSRYVGIGTLRSKHSINGPNGLKQVLVDDSQAIWDKVFQLSPGADIHLIGHSMGGGQIIAGLSDGKLGAHYQRKIKSITLITPLYELTNMDARLVQAAKLLRPMVKAALKSKVHYLAPHHQIIEKLFGKQLLRPAMSKVKENLNLFSEKATAFTIDSLSRFLIAVFHGFILNSAMTSVQEFRELIFTMSGISLELLDGFIEALIAGRLPVAMDAKYIQVPSMVVAADDDKLLPLDHMTNLQSQLSSAVSGNHLFVLLKGASHIDPIFSAAVRGYLYPILKTFHENPSTMTSCQIELLKKGA